MTRKRKRGFVGKVFKSVPAGISALINRAVDALSVELHLPRYRFCDPGTNLEERLARGERGINELDEACREHDITYAKYKDNENRRKADRLLAEKAWKRVKAWNSGVGERAYAAAVAAAMKAKSVVGGGLCSRRRRRHQRTSTRRRRRITTIRKTLRGGGVTRKRRVTKRKTARGLYLCPYRKN